jgi:hypothetical protein
MIFYLDAFDVGAICRLLPMAVREKTRTGRKRSGKKIGQAITGSVDCEASLVKTTADHSGSP